LAIDSSYLEDRSIVDVKNEYDLIVIIGEKYRIFHHDDVMMLRRTLLTVVYDDRELNN
tara:strand:- start:832 stop:1005 length:174 start_codon:yes stop_codon:yes gene_type:complete